jgi:hypothetical protein
MVLVGMDPMNEELYRKRRWEEGWSEWSCGDEANQHEVRRDMGSALYIRK